MARVTFQNWYSYPVAVTVDSRYPDGAGYRATSHMARGGLGPTTSTWDVPVPAAGGWVSVQFWSGAR